ncbi:MAG: hypothetical protein FJZ58_04485, partial [Chlamydiae bacterium]|nr:hypothetical protein [Chlamydiota bacterium]
MQNILLNKSQIYSLPVEGLLKEAKALVRLSALSKHMDSLPQQEISSWLISLQALWIGAMMTKEPLSSLKERLLEFDAQAASIYLTELERHPKKTNSLFQTYAKDHLALQSKPAVPADQGNSGGVILVKYLREDSSGNPNSTTIIEKVGVFKWTTVHEVLTGELMHYFADGFRVPKVAMIDIPGRVHIAMQRTLLDEQSCNYLNAKLTTLRANTKAKAVPAFATTVMVSEFVEGANLLDFIPTEWKSLDYGQKNNLLKTLGKIAFLHFVLGNTDGLVRFSLDFDSPIPTNMGNILLTTLSGHLELIAIDNTTDRAFIHNHNNARHARFIRVQRLFDHIEDEERKEEDEKKMKELSQLAFKCMDIVLLQED